MRHVSSSRAFDTSGTTIVSAGEILSGVVASGVAPTLIEVLSGGTVEDATFLGSSAEILQGGGDSGSVIGAGATQYVLSGGVVIAGSIAGHATVFSGGVSLSAQIQSGGVETVGFGALMDGASVLSGGSATIDGGGLARAATVAGGGTLAVSSGGSASGGIVAAGGTMIDQGLDGGTTVSSGGVVLVDGGSADNDTLLSGGLIVLLDGGVASGTIEDGGRVVSTGEVVFSGGAVSYVGSAVSYLSGGFSEVLVLDGGRIDSSLVASGALVEVLSGGAASFDVVSGAIEVLSGGIASGLTVTLLGVETVESGGIDSGTYMSFAFQNVLSGGLAVDDGVFAATQTVDGGTAIATDVLENGEQLVTGSGIALATSVTATGTLVVEDGGTAIRAQLFGSAFVSQGGVLEDAVLGQGGQAYVQAGGSVLGGTVMSDGLVIASSGALVSGLAVSSGGYVVALPGSVLGGIVQDGGEVVSTGVIVAPADGHLDYGQTLSGVDLGSGTARVLDGGLLVSASDGSVIVLSGGTVSGTVVYGGGAGPGHGVVEMTILSGGSGVDVGADSYYGRIVDSGGTVVSGHVSDQGTLFIQSGGVGEAGSASSGGVILAEGATTSGDHIFASGGEEADDGGVAGHAVVSGAYASMLALSGGIVSATVEGDGYITVSAGGYSTGSVIAAGGLERVRDGGVSTDDVASSGVVYAGSGGVLSNVTVEGGGIAYVGSGAVLDGAVVAGGGIVAVAQGASVGGIDLEGGRVVSTGVVEIAGDHVGTYLSQGLSGAFVSAGEVIVLSGGTASGVVAVGSPFALVGRFSVTPGQGTEILVQAGGRALGDSVGGSGALYGSVQEVGSGALASGTVVQADGEELVDAGGVSDDVVVAGAEVVQGTVSGAMVLSAGVLLVSSGGYLAGGHVTSGGFVELVGGTAAALQAETGALTLDVGAGVSFVGYQSAGASSASWDAGTGVLDVVVDGATVALALSGDYASDYFVVSGTASYVTVTVEQATPCYCPGTLILTDRGERPIETLRIGDRLVTRDGVARPLRWIGRRSYDGRFVAGRADILPVTFAPGSLGRDAGGQPVPRRPLSVSPLHALFLDGVLVPATALVDGRGIVQARAADRVEYIHLELDSHDVIVAEGALAESFVDDRSRGMFQNAAEHAGLYPDDLPRPALFCAPRIEDGDRLEEIRARLAA